MSVFFLTRERAEYHTRHKTKKPYAHVYDEMSAVCCYETIKQGYDTDIIVCYRQKSELMNLAKIVNQIIPRLVQDSISIEFFHLKINPNGVKNYLAFMDSVLEIMLRHTHKYVSMALSPLIFPARYTEESLKRVFEAEKIPILPLTGVDNGLFEEAREIGLERNMRKLERLITITVNETPVFSKKYVEAAIKTRREVTVKVGHNNVHDILDALENH